MGRATAESFAPRGAEVAVLDRTGSGGEDVAKALGGRFLPVDVTDFAGTEQVLGEAVDELGALHVVVTTAGGGIAAKTLGKDGPHDLQAFRDVLDLNTVATFNISRLAAAHMAGNEPEDDERGVIVNTSSDRCLRGADRPGGLYRGEGGHRRDVPDHGARPRLAGHPRAGDR